MGFQDALKRRLESIGSMGKTSQTVSQGSYGGGSTPAMNYYGGAGPVTGFGTQNTSSPITGFRGNLVKNVNSFVGTPYRWGGSKPGGFDCSGLVQFAYGKTGISMPRTSGQQSVTGKRVGINQLKPGDLVGWNRGGHIAVYAGNGEILESPRTGLSVRRRRIGQREGVFGVSLNLPGD